MGYVSVACMCLCRSCGGFVSFLLVNLSCTRCLCPSIGIAMAGMPIYFTSTLFSAVNLLIIIFLTAINCATLSFSMSFLRGYLILLPAIILMGWLFGINGVWAAVPVTELLITIIGFFLVHQQDHRLKLMEDARRKAELAK